MASLTPIFDGSYAGDLIYNATQFAIAEFKQYIESVDITYKSIYDRMTTGFDDTVYQLNSPTATNAVAEVSIGLVGDLPFSVMQQFIQLAKTVMGGGMTLIFEDDFATEKNYYGKWENAGDFVENNEVFGGGTLNLVVYKVTNVS